MNIDFTVIGERLKDARLRKKLTQEKLAEKMNMSVAYLSRIERGSICVNLKRLSELCSLLDVTEGEILNGTSKSSESYLEKDFAKLLKSCPPEKISLIYSVARIIAESNDKDKENIS